MAVLSTLAIIAVAVALLAVAGDIIDNAEATKQHRSRRP